MKMKLNAKYIILPGVIAVAVGSAGLVTYAHVFGQAPSPQVRSEQNDKEANDGTMNSQKESESKDEQNGAVDNHQDGETNDDTAKTTNNN